MNGIMLLVVLGVGYLIYLTYGKKLLAEGRKGHIKIAVIVLGLIILAAVATGRANVLMAPLGAAMALITRFKRFAPFLIRFFPQLKSFFGEGQVNAGGAYTQQGSANTGRSRVQSATLVMIFDHASGEMNGTVKRGQFEGYSLNELSVGELKDFLTHCKGSDPEAARLLTVYLERYHAAHFGGGGVGGGNGPGAGAGHGSQANTTTGGMNDQEALDILGLESGAAKDDIVKAHRSLIGKMHPDKGGSTYLATKINAARDHLLDG